MIVATPSDLPEDIKKEYKSRYKVQFDQTDREKKPKSRSGNRDAHVKPSKLYPVYPRDVSVNLPSFAGRVITCAETREYRVLARSQLTPDDRVLEIGSSTGNGTEVIAQHCANVVGVDISKELVGKARKQFPQLKFELLNALDPVQLGVLKDICLTEPEGVRKVVFMDIGGNRELLPVIQLLEVVEKQLRPELIVVKSRELTQVALEHISSCSEAKNQEENVSRIVDYSAWWAKLEKMKKELEDKRIHTGKVRHPQKYPKKQAPNGVYICRYHNYLECLQLRNLREGTCLFDHDHCHECLAFGHIALQCPAFTSQFGGEYKGWAVSSSEPVEP